MRRLLVHSASDVELAEVAAMPLAHDEIRVGVAYVGICGSDLHAIGEEDADAFGHEYSGIVREVGSAVLHLRPGQRVACLPRWPCGRCRPCRLGDQTRCRALRRPERGAWAEEIVVPARVAHLLPPEVSLRDGALCEPLACALRGIDRAQAPAGHAALVIGGGPIGLLTAALALRCGARSVLVSEPHATRRAIAERLGAVAFDPRERPLAEAVATLTGGTGVEVVYEAVGRGETVADAAEVVAPGGTVVVLGLAPPDAVAALRPWRLFERELTVTAAWGLETTFARALDWLRVLDLEPLVTHVLALERGAAAVALAASGDCGKVLIAPGGEADGDGARA